MENLKKKCSICGTENDVSANFCVNCGQANFVEVDSSAQEAISEEPSNKKSWKSVVIGIVAVIAFIIISSVGENFFDNYLHKITTENSGVEYTPGAVSGNTYVNEWAEISVTFPVDYAEASQETYKANESNNTECCLYFTSSTGNFFAILVEDVSLASKVDEKEYCELFIENMEESIEKYETLSPEFVVLEKGSKVEIAGHRYYCVSINVKFNAETVNSSVIENLYVRRIGTRMVGIMVASQNAEDIEEMISFIQPLNESK